MLTKVFTLGKRLTSRTYAVFQFPSNGKADPKSETKISGQIPLRRGRLSFNSLQTGKRIQSTPTIKFIRLADESRWLHSSFNSLQTGKRIQSHMKGFESVVLTAKSKFPDTVPVKEFQFPSNGKADPKSKKVESGTSPCEDPLQSFNSLQTGKRIQSSLGGLRIKVTFWEIVSIPFKRESGSKVDVKYTQRTLENAMFQFPSNGKADPKAN